MGRMQSCLVSIPLLFLFLILFRGQDLDPVKGKWFTEVEKALAAAKEQKRPVLLIWGREDQTIPFDTHKRVEETIPHLEFHAIDEAGHGPHGEKPELVNPLLIEFLMR